MKLKHIFYLLLSSLLIIKPFFYINAQTLKSSPDLIHGKLPNGFKYYIHKNTRPQARATIYLVVKAGSILESERERGFAHFIEHMSFNGTKNFTKDNLLDYIKKCGVRFGSDLNAYTGFEETVYQLPIPTDDPAFLELGLKITRDWAGEATLSPKETKSERGVVIEEMRQRLNASQRLQEQRFPILLNGSKYASRLPIGTKKVIENFSQSDLRGFYNKWYRPNLESVIVVGDIDVTQTRKMIISLFSSLRNPPYTEKRPSYHVVLDGKNRFQTLADPEQPQITIDITRKHYLANVRSEQDLEKKIQRMLFSTMLSTRLENDGQNTERPLSHIVGGFSPLMGGIEAFSVQFSTHDNQIESGFKYAWHLIWQIKEKGFSEDELANAKKKLRAQLLSSQREGFSRTSSYLADRYKQQFLTGEVFPGVSVEDSIYNSALSTTVLADVNKIAVETLSDYNRDIYISAPSKFSNKLPLSSEVEDWIAMAQKMEVKSPQTVLFPQHIQSSFSNAGQIDSIKNLGYLGVSEWYLSNGAKVVIKQTSDPSDKMYFMAISPGGTSLYSDKDFQSAANSASIVSSFGTKNLSAPLLKQFMDERQLNLQSFISEHHEGMQGSAPISQISDFLELIHQRFTSPEKDQSIFNKIIDDTRQGISFRHSNPDVVFSDTISAYISGGNSRRTAPDLRKVGEIDLERVMDIYRERFANAGDFTFIFVGRMDTLKLRSLCERYLASLPDHGIRENVVDIGIRTPKGQISRLVRAGITPKATVRLILGGDYQYTLNERMNVTALQEILQYRLLRKLREEKGGVYTPQVISSQRKYPSPRYSFTINFGCDPSRVDELIYLTQAEIRSMSESISQDDLDRFKAEQRRQNELALQDNGFYLGYLSLVYQDKENLDVFEKLVAEMESLKTSTLQDAAARLLSGENYLRFVLLPAS